jgi:3D (Asp-Asp-Asp) domain-containing protein
MHSILSQALIGLFALSGSTGTLANAAPAAVQAPFEPTPIASYTLSMTGYNAVPGQTDGDPDVTASGAFSNPEIVAARSQDLAGELPFGTVIKVESATTTPSCGWNAVAHQVGYRVIADSMNARMKQRIDILLDQDATVPVDGKQVNPGRALGVCKGVVVSVVGRIDPARMPATQDELLEMLEQSQQPSGDIALAS